MYMETHFKGKTLWNYIIVSSSFKKKYNNRERQWVPKTHSRRLQSVANPEVGENNFRWHHCTSLAPCCQTRCLSHSLGMQWCIRKFINAPDALEKNVNNNIWLSPSESLLSIYPVIILCSKEKLCIYKINRLEKTPNRRAKS